MAITLRLQKTEELTGETWFRIYQNDTCVKAFKSDNPSDTTTEHEATKFYEGMITRLQEGYPKTETLALATFSNAQSF